MIFSSELSNNFFSEFSDKSQFTVMTIGSEMATDQNYQIMVDLIILIHLDNQLENSGTTWIFKLTNAFSSFLAL